MKCIVVDDEPLALDLLESYVRKTPFLELAGKYSSAVQAMKELANQQVDLIFLDIQMPELNGLEFSRMLPPETCIIFTTAFDQYAINGYKVNAIDYLLKPISYPDFLQAANKALHQHELMHRTPQDEIDSIFVKSEYKLVQIELRKILYVEGLKDYIKIYEEDNPKPVLSLMSMKAMEYLLCPPRSSCACTALTLSAKIRYGLSTEDASSSARPIYPSATAINKRFKNIWRKEAEALNHSFCNCSMSSTDRFV